MATEGSVVALNGVLAKIDADETSHSKGSDEIKNSKSENETNTKPINIEHSPSAKKMMVENNITSNDLIGSGKQGRILKEDVKNYLNHKGKIAPEDKYEKEPKINYPIESQDRSLEDKKNVAVKTNNCGKLKSAQNTAAILTTYNEIDMTEVIKMRKTYKDEFEVKHSVKLGFMSFFIKACCHALLEIPEVNAEIRGTDIVYKNYVNMGVAVGTENGLVVPVINNANKLSFSDLEKNLNQLSLKARNGNLTISDMSGGTFTISNGGVYGSLMSSPILNPPQSGILGMHKIRASHCVIGRSGYPTYDDLALSYDHRIVDGKGAVTFLIQ